MCFSFQKGSPTFDDSCAIIPPLLPEYQEAKMQYIHFLFKLLKHYLHYLQYKAITGATYNNTIYITYITNQFDYLVNLQYSLYTTYKNCMILTSIL